MVKQFSLILGGGAARGLAHIGIIRRLEEDQIMPSCIVGTSIWAVIGAFYACGYTSHDMEGIAMDTDLLSLIDIDITKGGIKWKKIIKFLERYIGSRSFIDCTIPLKIIATDIDTGEKIVFSEGKIIDAIRASISIPGIFSPYKHDGMELVDGGLVANLPIEESLQWYPIIAVSILVDESSRIEKSIQRFFDIWAIKSTYRTLRKSMQIMIRQNEERSLCAYPETLILRIWRDDIDYYAFHRVSELVDEWYKTSEPIAQYLQNYGHK